MFNRLKRGELSTYAKYRVSVGTNDISKSTLLGYKEGNLATRVARTGFSWVQKAVAALMLAMILFVTVNVNAPKAQAWPSIEEIVTSLACSAGNFNFQTENKGALQASTGDGFDDRPTAYEKFGLAGTTFTSWSGFTIEEGSTSSIMADRGKGMVASKSIVQLAGNTAQDSGLDQWSGELAGKPNSGLWNVRGTCANWFIYSSDVISNFFMKVAGYEVWIGNQIYEMATSPNYNLLNKLSDGITAIGLTLKDNLFFAYLAPVIMIGGLYIGYVGWLKREATKSFAFVAWMIGAIAVSVVILSKPLIVPEMAIKTSTAISQSMLGTVMSGENSNEKGKFKPDLCKLPAGAKDRGLRTFQCNQWYSLVYEPWVLGEFGVTHKEMVESGDFQKMVGSQSAYRAEGMDIRTTKVNGLHTTNMNVKLGKWTPNNQSWALAMLDYKSNWDGASPMQKVNKTKGMYNVAASQLGSVEYNETFKGENSTHRLLTSFSAFAVAGANNLLILVVSISLLVSQFIIIVMSIFLPWVALMSVVSEAGKRMSLNYMKTIGGEGLKIIILTLYLAIMLKLLNVINQPTSNPLEWFGSLLLIMIVALAGVSFKSKIINKLTSGLGFQGLDIQGGGGAGGKGMKAMAPLMGLAGAAGGALGSLAGTRFGNKGGKKVTDDIKKNASIAGAGRSPQQQWNTGESATGKNNSESKGRSTDENREGTSQPDNSGGGQAPQAKESEPKNEQEQSYNSEAPESPQNGTQGDSEDSQDASGAGKSPEQDTDESKAQQREARREAKAQDKAEHARIRTALRSEGYGQKVGVGTILWAATKGAVVGGVTGNARAGFRASSGVVNARKQTIQARNEQAVQRVTQNEKNRNWELERKRRKDAFEKQQEQRQKEREEARKNFNSNPKAPQGTPQAKSGEKQHGQQTRKPDTRIAANLRKPTEEQRKASAAPKVNTEAPKPRTANPPAPKAEASKNNGTGGAKQAPRVTIPTGRSTQQERKPAAAPPVPPRNGNKEAKGNAAPPLPPRREARKNAAPNPNSKPQGGGRQR